MLHSHFLFLTTPIQTWVEMKKNVSIEYDPKKGFTLTNLPNPLGRYKCVANSDDKDWATVHVIPSTSPGIKERTYATERGSNIFLNPLNGAAL